MKRNYIFKISLFAVTLIAALFILKNSVAYAQIGTDLYINGLKFETDVELLLKDDTTFVPIRVIGEMLGYDVNYDTKTSAITMNHQELNVNITFTVGSKMTSLNGEATEIQSAPIIVSGRTMVPVRFVSEALDSEVVWRQGVESDNNFGVSDNNKVFIYCSLPITVSSADMLVSSSVFKQSWSLEGSGGEEKTIGYDIIIPVISGMKDSRLQDSLNKLFIEKYSTISQEIESIYEEQGQEAAEFRYNASNGVEYSVVNEGNGIISFILEGYAYMGGAHGFPNRQSINIDLNNSKILNLSDIFKTGTDYKQILMDEMNNIRILSSTEEYVDVSEVTELPSNEEFYISNGNIVLFYHPYDLSYYARGFVEFRIPLLRISEYLNDGYL